MAEDGNYYGINLDSEITISEPYKYEYIKTPLVESPHVLQDKFLFSFQYFNQADLFGLGGAKTAWFISIFERLTTLSKMGAKEREILLSGGKRTHSHRIIWGQSPISRKAIDWIPEDITEDDIVQINISTGKGRIIGFFDECIFNVIFLDEKHNMQSVNTQKGQPSKTVVGESQYDKLEHKYVELIKCIEKANNIDVIKEKVNKLHDKDSNYIIACELDQEYYSYYLSMRNNDKFKEIIENVVLEDMFKKETTRLRPME